MEKSRGFAMNFWIFIKIQNIDFHLSLIGYLFPNTEFAEDSVKQIYAGSFAGHFA